MSHLEVICLCIINVDVIMVNIALELKTPLITFEYKFSQKGLFECP